MVDIQLRKRALTKAGYEAVYNEAMKGYHLRLPDGEYHTEHVSGLPDWFATEDLAWRAAPAVETSVDLALFMLKEMCGHLIVTVSGWRVDLPVVIPSNYSGYQATMTGVTSHEAARAICETYLFYELEVA